MSFAGPRIAARAATALAIALILCVAAPWTRPAAPALLAAPSDTPAASGETRALWVLRTSLTTPASIATLVRSARDNGFNTLLVQVRGRGDAYYQRRRSSLAPPNCCASRRASIRSPTVLTRRTPRDCACTRGSTSTWSRAPRICPTAREHIIYRHPEWLMVPRDIAQELARRRAGKPRVRRQARALDARRSPTRSKGSTHRRSCPRRPRTPRPWCGTSRRAMTVDGVHLDYARYPSERFDYSRAAIREFRGLRPPDARRRPRAATLDAREPDDLFAYPDALPDEWRGFRIARMTALMSRLRAAVKAERPDAMVTVATAPDLREALRAASCRTGAQLAASTASSTASARWLTRRNRRDSPNRSPRPAKRPAAAHLGGHRRVAPVADGDRREHPDGPASRRLRHHPLFLRQPDRTRGRPRPAIWATVGRAAFTGAAGSNSSTE